MDDPNNANSEFVRLKCSNVGGKLRVRIISSGYNSQANCQFPKKIREDGREYLVPRSDITFTENSKQKFFYRVKPKNVKILTQNNPDHSSNKFKAAVENLKIYEDENQTECIVCMTDSQDITYVIFVSCGHYNTCKGCASKLKTCPTCRSPIKQIVTKDQL